MQHHDRSHCARCTREQQVCADCTATSAALERLQRTLDEIEFNPATHEQRERARGMCEVFLIRSRA